MNSPELELQDILIALTENDDPKLHRATVRKYFTEDASFIHPLAVVKASPHSRDQLQNVYNVYKFFTKDIHIKVNKLTVDSNCTRAVVELEEDLTPSFFPFVRVRGLKIVSILDFERVDNKFYIKKQYDAFPLDAISEWAPLGFFYSWYKQVGGITGNFFGGVISKWGLF